MVDCIHIYHVYQGGFAPIIGFCTLLDEVFKNVCLIVYVGITYTCTWRKINKWDRSSPDCNVKMYLRLANYQQGGLKFCIKLFHSLLAHEHRHSANVYAVLNINLNMKICVKENI